jgi:hypothetical protein
MKKNLNNDIVTNQQIITSKIKEARLAYDTLKRCIDVIHILDNGDLHDQLITWFVNTEQNCSAQERVSYCIRRLEEVHGVKYDL